MVLVRFVICAIRRALLCLFFSFLPFSSQKNVRSKHTVKGSSNTLHSNRITFGRERERIAYQFVRISGRVFLLVSKSFTRKRKKKKKKKKKKKNYTRKHPSKSKSIIKTQTFNLTLPKCICSAREETWTNQADDDPNNARNNWIGRVFLSLFSFNVTL